MDDLQTIQKQINELRQKEQSLIQQKKGEVVETIKALIKAFGITSRDLGFHDSFEPTKGVPKYKQGVLVWTGKGRKPGWVVDFLAKGGKIEDLRITK